MSDTQIPIERLDDINRFVTVARLLSAAVHDVSNALQIVTGNGELLDGQPDDPDQVRLRARMISAHADRASRRLRDLVGLLSEAPAPPHRVDLADLVERLVVYRKSTLGRARTTLSVELPPGPVYVRAHGGALLRLLLNLVLNAEEAVRGRPGARIAIAARPSEPGHIEIRVTDNGPGIAPDRQATLFEAFSSQSGAGLGLCVGRYLAERQGGTLQLDPASSDGASFVVMLPAAG